MLCFYYFLLSFIFHLGLDMEQNRTLRVVYRATSSLISSCLALFCLAFVNQFTYSILFRFYFNPSNSNSIYPSFDAFDVLDAFDAVPGRGVSSIVLSCLVLSCFYLLWCISGKWGMRTCNTNTDGLSNIPHIWSS